MQILPNELLDEIFQYDLENCCLLNKRFTEKYIKLAYRMIEFPPRPLNGFDDIFLSKNTMFPYASYVIKLYVDIERLPWDYMRNDLFINVTHLTIKRWLKIKTLFKVIDMLPKLEYLHLEPYSGAEIQLSDIKFPPLLRKLIIYERSLPIDQPQDFKCLNKYPHLTSLITDYNFVSNTPQLYYVTYLTISRTFDYYDIVLAPIFPNLEFLRIMNSNESFGDKPKDFSSFLKLKELHCWFDFIPGPIMESVVYYLSDYYTFPSLDIISKMKTIAIKCDDLNVAYHMQSKIESFIDAIEKQTTNCSIYFSEDVVVTNSLSMNHSPLICKAIPNRHLYIFIRVIQNAKAALNVVYLSILRKLTKDFKLVEELGWHESEDEREYDGYNMAPNNDHPYRLS